MKPYLEAGGNGFSYTLPGEVVKQRLVDKKPFQPFTVETLLVDLFRPHYKYFGTNLARIDGVYTEKRPGQHFTLVDFSHPEEAGANIETLVAISAALQGSRISASKKLDTWEVEEKDRPIAYEELFIKQLRSWIKASALRINEIDFDQTGKQNFYHALSGMINIVLKGDHSEEAFKYFIDKDKESRGFSIYRSFFPNLAEKINEDGILYLLNISRKNREDLDFEEVLRGFIQNEPKNFFDIDTGIELAFLLQFSRESINSLLEIKKNYPFIEINWSLSKDNIIEAIKDAESGNSPKRVPREEIVDIVDDYPKLEQYGLKNNELETALMQEHYSKPDAVVISPAEIRRHPASFWEFQRALVLKIAERQQKHLNLKSDIPIPDGYTDEQATSFRSTEKILKDVSDWLGLLLYPSVQKEFFERMPYIRVPPYIVIDGKAIPISDEAHKNEIVSKIIEDERSVINELPFLNFVDMEHIKRLKHVGSSRNLTLPGQLIREFIGKGKQRLKEGAFVYIDHGIARWVLGSWGETTPLDPLGYIAYGRYPFEKLATVDVDMMVFNTQETLGDVGIRMVNGINPKIKPRTLMSSRLLGLSMGRGIDYTYIVKRIDRMHLFNIKNDPYMLAHSQACITQAVRGWQAKDSRQKTKLLVESLIGFSKIRSFGLIPDLVTDDSGSRHFAVKPIDVFGGLMDYTESGGGIEAYGKRKNVIRFVSLEKAFSTDSIWHALRTVGDMLYTRGGAVLLPDGLIEIQSDKANDSAFSRASEIFFRNVLKPIYDYINNVQSGLKDTQQKMPQETVRRDLRQEIIKSAKDMIDNDPVKFMSVCSDISEFDGQNVLFGLELSRFFPHLDILRKNKEVWQRMKEAIKSKNKLQEESGLHFVARAILEAKDFSILEVTANSLRNELAKKPLRTAKKLATFQKPGEKENAINETGMETMANWALLDPHGLYHYVNQSNTRKWISFISYLEAGLINLPRLLENTKNIFEALEATDFLWHFAPTLVRLRFPEGQNFIGKAIEDQINALADWLIDPGF